MAARLAFAGEIVVDELAVACRTEAREMTAVHDGDGKRAHAVQRLDIVVDPAVIDVVDQRTVIDDVARQEDACLLS